MGSIANAKEACIPVVFRLEEGAVSSLSSAPSDDDHLWRPRELLQHCTRKAPKGMETYQLNRGIWDDRDDDIEICLFTRLGTWATYSYSGPTTMKSLQIPSHNLHWSKTDVLWFTTNPCVDFGRMRIGPGLSGMPEPKAHLRLTSWLFLWSFWFLDFLPSSK